MKNVIIFGTALRGSEAYFILSQLSEYQVIAFSCNDEVCWGREKEGLPIISPEDIPKRYKDAIIVIASAYYIEIKKQLLDRKLVPAERCLESIHEIIGKLPDESRVILKSQMEGKTAFCNLDYWEIDVPAVENTEKKYLMICNGGYPCDGNPRCMFAHQRALEYKNAGLDIEAFGLIKNAPFEQYDYEGIHVLQGGTAELTKLLVKSNYKKFLIHFIDAEVMYAINQARKENAPMIVWCHGCDVESWTSRWFCYSPEEIAEKCTSLYETDCARSKSLKTFFERKNILFIFVSNWLANRAKKFVGRLPENYSVIHNYINCDYWSIAPVKTAQDRFRILSIKNQGTRTYANDLTAKAILELSKKDFFEKMTFELYGDGVLFEENFRELLQKNFPNVYIHRTMLNHTQMKEKFSQNGIFLSPTRLDSQGVSANEAMAAGMAVISCSTAAIPEFMDEDCASLFEYDNYWMMAEEIEYLYYHPEEFLRKSKNAVQRVEKQCGYKQTIARELELILGT